MLSVMERSTTLEIKKIMGRDHRTIKEFFSLEKMGEKSRQDLILKSYLLNIYSIIPWGRKSLYLIFVLASFLTRTEPIIRR